jgi:hypothetical protein
MVLAVGLVGCGIDGVDAKGGTTTKPGSPTTPTSDHGPGSGAPLVDKAEAEKAVNDFMKANNDANSTLDTSILVNVETGGAAAIDEAWYRGQKNLGTKKTSTFTWTDVHVYLPRSTDYPLVFLATVAFTTVDSGNQGVQVQIYEKASSSAAWKLSHYDNLPEGSVLPELDVDDQGYLAPLDPEHGFVLTPKQVVIHLGALMNDPNAETLINSSQIIEDGRAVVVDRVAPDSLTTLKHDVHYDTPSAPGYRDYAFPLKGGGMLDLGVLGVREIILPIDPTSSVQIQDSFAAGLVPKGDSYKKVETRSLFSFMATVPTKKDGGKVDLVAIYQGIISARAE